MKLEEFEKAVEEGVKNAQGRIVLRLIQTIHTRHLSGVNLCDCGYCVQLYEYVEAKKKLHRAERYVYREGMYLSDTELIALILPKRLVNEYGEARSLHLYLGMMRTP